MSASRRPRPVPAAAALVAAALLGAVAGCGAGSTPAPGRTSVLRATPAVPVAEPPTDPAPAGPTARQVADALDAISPTRHPRDNTGTCAAKGCLGLVTAGTVSVYQWSTLSAASHFIGDGSGTADLIGTYVLSYRTHEQKATPATVRKAYADKVRQMVGPPS